MNKQLLILVVVVCCLGFVQSRRATPSPTPSPTNTPTLPSFPSSFSALINQTHAYYFDSKYQRIRTNSDSTETIYDFPTGRYYSKFLGVCWNESISESWESAVWTFPTTDVVFVKSTVINEIESNLFEVKKGKEKGEYAVSVDTQLPVLFNTWYTGEYYFSNFTVRSFDEYEPFFDWTKLDC